MGKVIRLLLVVWALASCQKDDYFGPVYLTNPGDSVRQADTVYLIGCEGNFQLSNASLSQFTPSSGEFSNDVFQQVNGRAVGDVLQSVYHHGDSVFLVVNNSGIIRILDDSSLIEVGTIEGLESPRHMLFLDRNRALVSDFGGSNVHVIDLKSAAIINSIDAPVWTEQMELNQGRVVVADMKDSALYSLNASTLSSEETFDLSIEPKHLLKSGDHLFIAGNAPIGSKVLKFDGASIETVYASNEKLSSASNYGDSIYVLFENRVVVLYPDGSEGEYLHTLKTPYGIFSDQEYLILTDAQGFVGAGKVHIWNTSFDELDIYESGYIPQAVCRVINK